MGEQIEQRRAKLVEKLDNLKLTPMEREVAMLILQNDVAIYSEIHDRYLPVSRFSPSEVLATMRRLEKKGVVEVREVCKVVELHFSFKVVLEPDKEK